MSSSSTTAAKKTFATFIAHSSASLSELNLQMYRALSQTGLDLTEFYTYAKLASIVYQTTRDDAGNVFLIATNQTRFHLPTEMAQTLLKLCPARIHFDTADGGSSWVDPEETVVFRNTYGFTIQPQKFNHERFDYVSERKIDRDGRSVTQHYRDDALFIRFPPADVVDEKWATDQMVLITDVAETTRQNIMSVLGYKSDKTISHEVGPRGITVKFSRDIPLGCRALIHSWYAGRVTRMVHTEGETSYYEYNHIRVDWALDLRNRSKSHRNSTAHSRT